MPRTPSPSLILALALASVSTGCSTPFGPAPSVAEPPALLSALPDGPDVALQSTVIEMPAPVAAPAARPAKPAVASRATRPGRTGRGPAPREAAAAGAASAAPGSAAAGPSVTTYTYSDAPVAVRRADGQNAGRDAPVGRPAAVPAGFNPYRIAMPAGPYRCELGRSVHVRDVSADMRTTVLRWGTTEYTLRAVHARSGALRYEDASSGLAWIVIPGTSMLLDTRQGQRLANACRA